VTGGAGSAGPVQSISARDYRPVLLRMKLPFTSGERYDVYQGNHGAFSHVGLNEYAWDFGLPENTKVCAVAQGRVVRVKQDSDVAGTTPEYYGQANTVILDHGNGCFSQYLHLKKGSAQVAEGDIVQGGQPLALSGNTGFSSTPHLHFQVQTATGQSVPSAFVDVPGDGVPKPGAVYLSDNDGRGVSLYAGESPLPSDAFRANRIVLNSTDLPGHLLRRDRPYRVSGWVNSRSSKVAIYLMGPEGGRALLAFYADVLDDGSFSRSIDLSSLPRRVGEWSAATSQSNIFAIAISPVKADGSFWSNISVPVTVR
jgi:murein DD-endopeptidase MepM/ murein hydrolase activator NlpD